MSKKHTYSFETYSLTIEDGRLQLGSIICGFGMEELTLNQAVSMARDLSRSNALKSHCVKFGLTAASVLTPGFVKPPKYDTVCRNLFHVVVPKMGVVAGTLTALVIGVSLKTPTSKFPLVPLAELQPNAVTKPAGQAALFAA